MRSHHLCVLVLQLVLQSVDAQVIPAERLTDWSEPGAREAFEPVQTASILDFGGDPTGVNGCDAALTAAINSLGGPGEVLFPAGDYRFTQAINLPDSIILQG